MSVQCYIWGQAVVEDCFLLSVELLSEGNEIYNALQTMMSIYVVLGYCNLFRDGMVYCFF